MGAFRSKPLATKSDAHLAFDALWQWKLHKNPGMSKSYARTAAYRWLAKAMNLPRPRCHMRLMNREQCQQVVNLCRPYVEKIRNAQQQAKQQSLQLVRPGDARPRAAVPPKPPQRRVSASDGRDPRTGRYSRDGVFDARDFGYTGPAPMITGHQARWPNRWNTPR